MSLLRRLWRLEGTVDRRTYLACGVLGFALKYAIDWSIATLLFHVEWSPFSYWRLLRLDRTAAAHIPPSMFVLMLAVAVPFLWFGMSLTLLRLRDAGQSAGWAAVFFVPFLNALLFGTLVLLPSREPRDDARLTTLLESALFAVVGSVAIAASAIALSTEALGLYGIGLFVAIPFCVGYVAAFLHARRYPNRPSSPYVIAFLSLLLLAGFLVAVAWEGIVCLIMAAPLALPVGLIGAYLGTLSAQAASTTRRAPYLAIVVLPALLVTEAAVRTTVPTFRVESSIEVNAPIETVWNNVVTFSDIAEAPAWYFRAGIAYPLRARIAGHGAGAIRSCEFSTGTFVEPITVWQEPSLLRFGVTANPEPMREFSPYGRIKPAHLKGFLVSRQGQFELVPLGRNRTRITGTTWYQHHLWPSTYWAWWSDAIIHRIHMRVLRHIKVLSERPAA